MNRWNTVITTSAASVTGPPPESTSASGNAYSRNVPKWVSVVESAEGRRSSGNERYMRRFSQAGENGLLLTITHITAGKWRITLDVAAHHHTASHTPFEPAIQSAANSRQTSTDRERKSAV